VRAFAANARAAVQANLIIEETTQLALYAEGLGGPTILTPDRINAAIDRCDSFSAEGTRRTRA
jgi:hypothetical protein